MVEDELMFGRKKRKEKRRFYKRKGFLIFGGICLLLICIGVLVVFKKLEPYQEQANGYDLELIDRVKEPSLIHDRNGIEIGRMFSENRDKIPIEDVPQLFIDALLAQEDQRFFEHDGVDWVGVARAVYLNVKSGGVTQGAGTITMQLVRNAFDLLGEARRSDQTSYERKIVEAFLALRVEKKMLQDFEEQYPDPDARKKAMKTQLLQFYINRVPFGSGYYGVRSASLGYFGKEPRDLELHECASIVACVKNPSRLNPLRNPKLNKVGRDHVIRRMALEEMISSKERDRLLSLPVQVNPRPILRGKSHLYEKIETIARAKIGEEVMAEGGFVIRTTIDSEIQDSLKTALRDQLNAIEARPGYPHQKYQDFKRGKKAPEYLQGAALIVDHLSGEAIAHVGGRNYSHSQYDFLELGRRPLGTAFFPFIHAISLENGKSPASPVLDAQMNNRQLMVGGLEGVVGEWGMEIMKPEYSQRDITARQALIDSKIAATVRLGADIGLKKIMEGAQGFGFDFPEEKVLNRNLVGWNPASVPEVVSAYSSFANEGQRLAEVSYIQEIRDSFGVVIYSAAKSRESQYKSTCSPATAYQIHTMLNDVLTSGNLKESSSGLTGSAFPGGGKTGTPYGFADAWMAGYTGRLTGAVWVGFHQGGRKPIVPMGFAKELAYPIWQTAMNAARSKFKGEEIKMPSDVQEVVCCRHSGQKPTLYCNRSVEDPLTGEVSFRSTSYKEYFKKGTKVGICSIHGAGVDLSGLTDVKPPRKALPVVPIKSKAPLLIGADPYQSEKPSLAPEDTNAGNVILLNDDTLVVEDRVKGEKRSLLRLPRPPRFQLPNVVE